MVDGEGEGRVMGEQRLYWGGGGGAGKVNYLSFFVNKFLFCFLNIISTRKRQRRNEDVRF